MRVDYPRRYQNKQMNFAIISLIIFMAIFFIRIILMIQNVLRKSFILRIEKASGIKVRYFITYLIF